MSNFFIPENKGTDPAGRFLDRNTNAGIFGAVIYAMILNQLGDESEALIKAAGLTPSSKDTTQWLQAIRKLYGDADTALKEKLINKIEALTASDITFEDSISISASDVQEAITALHTLIKGLKAKDITIDNIEGITAYNLQEAIESIVLNKIKPIGSVYYQISELNGSFDNNKSPEKLFGGTWQILHNNEGIFLRTEGGYANENRINGVQDYAIINIQGTLGLMSWSSNGQPYQSGCFQIYVVNTEGIATIDSSSFPYPKWINTRAEINFNNLGIPVSNNEIRVKNRLIRIWLRIA